MRKLIKARIAALVGVIASSVIVSGCETSVGKPEVCEPKGSARCAKIKPVMDDLAAKPSMQKKSDVTTRSRSDY